MIEVMMTMTRAWAPNRYDVVDWPVGKGLTIENEPPDWRARAAQTNRRKWADKKRRDAASKKASAA